MKFTSGPLVNLGTTDVDHSPAMETSCTQSLKFKPCPAKCFQGNFSNQASILQANQMTNLWISKF